MTLYHWLSWHLKQKTNFTFSFPFYNFPCSLSILRIQMVEDNLDIFSVDWYVDFHQILFESERFELIGCNTLFYG